MTLRLSGGRRLRSPVGEGTRPTAARVRLAVMNLLADRLPGCRWLDLCCGSGAMACEALQRGARQVVGVERDRRIAAVARANLEAVAGGLAPREDGETMRVASPGFCRPKAEVVNAEVLRWLGRGAVGSGHQPFDLIYTDPPYAAGLHGPIAAAVKAGGWLRPGGVLVWECDRRQEPGVPAGWRLADHRVYGGTSLLLLAPADPGP